jgi:hypothetical protein
VGGLSPLSAGPSKGILGPSYGPGEGRGAAGDGSRKNRRQRVSQARRDSRPPPPPARHALVAQVEDPYSAAWAAGAKMTPDQMPRRSGWRASGSRQNSERRRQHMIRIAITQAAFDTIAATLPLGSVGYENEINERGERLIWLEPNVVNRLRAMRGPGESFSDVILRLA